MSLTKAQYDEIQREYQETQNQNHRLLQERREEVFSALPEYQKLSGEIASLSVKHARLLLEGDENALQTLKGRISVLSLEKKKLLTSAGFPENYLEPIYTCPKCQDTGFMGSEKCSCLRQKEISLLYEQSNIQELIQRENFDTLSYTYYQGEDLKRFETAVGISKNFVAGFSKHYQNLFFYGTVGTGKSFLSGCIAGELLSQGYSVIYFSANGLFEQLASYSFNTKLKESLYNFYKDLYNCDLMIIDDLGTEVTNSFVTSQLFGLLNERHLRQKATIISTNLGLEELRDRYSDRVFSRITSNYSLCKLSGPDIRISKKLSGKLS
ncbi:MAG: ATP-binding protein [Lachnospiraceae bacterium]|nr:ATP-binding protein [Lachnospiraceae bacterium]